MNPRILVAEDNLAFSKVLRLAFERSGLHVTVATDGEQALGLLQAQSFDALITDEQMPRMCGRVLCQRLREDAHFSDLPIFFCTAKSWELNAESLKQELGVVEVFQKPFSPRRVAMTVADYCQQHRPACSQPRPATV
jgi:CheY-like chemotaxis protein